MPSRNWGPKIIQRSSTYSLTTDVWMPDLGVELHDGRSEGILSRDPNIYNKLPTLVRGAGRASDTSLEVCQVTPSIVGGSGRNVRDRGISLDVGQFLGDSTNPIASHDGFQHFILGGRA